MSSGMPCFLFRLTSHFAFTSPCTATATRFLRVIRRAPRPSSDVGLGFRCPDPLLFLVSLVHQLLATFLTEDDLDEGGFAFTLLNVREGQLERLE